MADDTPEPKQAAVHAPTEPALPQPGALDADDESPLKRVTLAAADGSETIPPSARRSRDIESYVGYIIDGRYQIESVLAQGGMGMVYLARHRLLEKPVAVKILRPELVHDRDITRRFLTEAQAASAIGNEHIVDVTDFGELPDGATYIVMEYLDGQSLGQLLQTTQGPLPVELVLHIARQIAEGLQPAHDANIVHRDLKPDNIQLVQRHKQEHFVKILDFGIAKVASSQNDTTRAGKIFGTPYYMSPEQAKGDALDQRTDVYALGVILFEMLTGHVPFEGENPLGILTQHMYVDPPPLGPISGVERLRVGLEAVVGRCLLKEPAQRYESMSQLDEDLARLQQGDEPLAVSYLTHSPRTPEDLAQRLRGVPPKSASRWPLWAAAGGLLSLVGIGWALAASELPSWWATPAPEPPSAPATAPEASSAPAPAARFRTVALVVSPIDAHVFQGERDLGMMPINVRIREGQRVELSVRRRNYEPRSVLVDGSESRIVVQLSPIAGRASAALTAASEAGVARQPALAADAGRPPPSKTDGGAPSALARHPMSASASAPVRGPIIDLSDLGLPPPPPGPPPRDEPLAPSKQVKLPPPPPSHASEPAARPPGPRPLGEPVTEPRPEDRQAQPPATPNAPASSRPAASG